MERDSSTSQLAEFAARKVFLQREVAHDKAAITTSLIREASRSRNVLG